MPGPGGTFNFEIVTIVGVELSQRLDKSALTGIQIGPR